MGNSDDTLAGSIDQDTKGTVGTSGPSRGVDPKELTTTTADEARVSEIVEPLAGMAQARRMRPWWTAIAGITPLVVMGYLAYLPGSGMEIKEPALITLTIVTFSSFVVIHSVILIGLYRISRSDASQGHLWGVIRQLLGKGQDPSP